MHHDLSIIMMHQQYSMASSLVIELGLNFHSRSMLTPGTNISCFPACHAPSASTRRLYEQFVALAHHDCGLSPNIDGSSL